jgi:hypothetical protein
MTRTLLAVLASIALGVCALPSKAASASGTQAVSVMQLDDIRLMARGGGMRAGGGGVRAGGGFSGGSRDIRSRASSNVNFNGNRNANFNRNTNVNVRNNVNFNNGNFIHGECYGGCYRRDWDDYHPVATAAAVTAAAVATAAVVGSIAYSVPSSCVTTVVGGVSYYQCGSTWYQPQYAGTNVQYVVVNPPG